jgi:post-segregation antitoxin (ccd killing protein)
MGRHRLPEEKKKITLHLTITKEVVDQLKEREVNISQLVEDFKNIYKKML